MKLIHMAFNLQMNTHSSSKTQNAHCHDIRKNLGGISVFLCVSSPSTQTTKRKTRVYFLGLIWGLQHISQRHSRARCLSDKTVLHQFYIIDNLHCGVFKRILLMPSAKAIKYYFNRPNRRQLWNGILWLYSKHHPVFFSRRKNRQLVLHHLIDLIWGDTDKRTFFFFFDKRTFYKNFMVNKVSEETESSCVFNVGSTFLRTSKRKFLSLLILTFSIWQMLIFFPFCLCF